LGGGLGIAVAGPIEDALVAAMRLSEKPNYSWTATVTDDARTYDITGQINPAGFSRVKMPVVNAVGRRLGRSVTDTEVEFIFLGNVACVVATDQGWKRLDELPPPLPGESTGRRRSGRPPGGGPIGGIGPGSRGGYPGASPRPPGNAENRSRGYSNLQLGLSPPHEELGIIVSSHHEFRAEGEVVTGTLTDRGAQLLLVRDGQKEITPLQAAGTFTLWIREGGVDRYQVRLEGLLEVDTPAGRQKVIVKQNTDTVIKNVGATQFEIPEEARAKLAR
jgi:hypothetical protein